MIRKSHTSFAKNVAVMMSGRVAAAMIALFSMPIVARLFTPGDFGVAAMFISIVAIASTAASLRYEVALVLPKEPSDARNVLALASHILLAVSAAFLILLLALEVLGLHPEALETLGVWKWLLPLGILLSGMISIQESWLTRTKAFTLASGSLVVGNSVNSGSRIVMGALFGSSVYALIAGYIAGLASRMTVQHSATTEVYRALRSSTWHDLKQSATHYGDFPKYNAPAGLVFSIGQNAPILLFGLMFSPVVAGLFQMANRLSQTPTTIGANSVRRVFLQRAAAIHSKGGNLRRAFTLVTLGIGAIGCIPFACLWLYGQPLLTWLLGDEWSASGRYIEIMAPWLFTVWLAAPSNPIFIVLRKQRFFLIRQAVLTALRLLAFLLAYLLGKGPEWTLHAFVGVTVVANLVTIASVFEILSRQARNPT